MRNDLLIFSFELIEAGIIYSSAKLLLGKVGHEPDAYATSIVTLHEHPRNCVNSVGTICCVRTGPVATWSGGGHSDGGVVLDRAHILRHAGRWGLWELDTSHNQLVTTSNNFINNCKLSSRSWRTRNLGFSHLLPVFTDTRGHTITPSFLDDHAYQLSKNYFWSHNCK